MDSVVIESNEPASQRKVYFWDVLLIISSTRHVFLICMVKLHMFSAEPITDHSKSVPAMTKPNHFGPGSLVWYHWLMNYDHDHLIHFAHGGSQLGNGHPHLASQTVITPYQQAGKTEIIAVSSNQYLASLALPHPIETATVNGIRMGCNSIQTRDVFTWLTE
jgi:hypothetical protein